MDKNYQKPNFEFIALMAALMSIVALAVDAILPAISEIGTELNSVDPTKNQLLISMIFLGLGVGQLFFGPLSDSFGRKPIVHLGLGVFGFGCIICIMASSLEMMIIGRVLQGIGIASPRTLCVTIIRDSYAGDYMAKVMSFVVGFFFIIPIIAPAIGKVILDSMGWKAIFYSQLFLILFIGIWFWKRQVETLKPEFKIPFSIHIFKDGLRAFLKFKETIVYTLLSGLVTSVFLVFLSASQHVFENQYQLKEAFPYIFSGLAISLGLATLLNGTLVVKFGMHRLSYTALLAFCCIAMVYSLLFWKSPNPSIFVLVGFLSALFFCLGFMWGNFRSIAMEPIGHIAGIGAAINGFFSNLMAIPIASFIGSFIKDTVWPLFFGLSICGLLSLLIVLVSNKTNVFSKAYK